jgi:hypothetical protein
MAKTPKKEKATKRPKVNFKPEAWVKISELKEHPKNPRKDLKTIPEKFESLKRSIQEGVFEPVKVSTLSGFCIAGNQRLKAFSDLGFDEVPVQYNSYENEKDEIRDMIKDNNEWGEYEQQALSILIEELELTDTELGLEENFMNVTIEPENSFGGLEDEKGAFETMTFTLSSEQAKTVKKAMAIARVLGADEAYKEENENGNGNALAYACEMFITHQNGEGEEHTG